MSESGTDLLKAHHVVEYPYHRSVGPVMGRFFTGLRDGRIEGVRADGGRVVVPPSEYDPDSGNAVGEAVGVASSGTVVTWCWVSETLPHHLLDHPFAFGLIKLDGADTALLHYIDAGSIEAMSTGMRVRADWQPSRAGHITDIRAFVPESGAAGAGPVVGGAAGGSTADAEADGFAAAADADGSPATADAVSQILTPIRLDYDVIAGTAQTPFLKGLI